MTKLEQYDGFVITDKDAGTTQVFIGETSLAQTLAWVEELSGNTTIIGMDDERDGSFMGHVDVTDQIAQRAADTYVEDQYHDLQSNDWSENACDFISAHAQDYLDTAIEEAREDASNWAAAPDHAYYQQHAI